MSSWNRVWVRVSLMVAVAALVGGIATAGVPTKMNCQGKLTDSVTGQPLTGTHNMTFRLYDYLAGGPVLRSEDMPVTADSASI